MRTKSLPQKTLIRKFNVVDAMYGMAYPKGLPVSGGLFAFGGYKRRKNRLNTAPSLGWLREAAYTVLFAARQMQEAGKLSAYGFCVTVVKALKVLMRNLASASKSVCHMFNKAARGWDI